MKLHRNRKKRNRIKRFFSLALICCMILSMGSSYTTTEAASQQMLQEGAMQNPVGLQEDNAANQEAPEQPAAEKGATSGAEDLLEPVQTEPSAEPGAEESTSPEEGKEPGTEAPTSPEEGKEPGVGASTSPEEGKEPGAGASTSPEEGKEPGTEESTSPQEPSDAEVDYGDLVSPEELGQLPEDQVGAAVWSASSPERAMGPESQVQDGRSFDIYYMKQDDWKHVEKTEDFNLKYQMHFHADRQLERGDVEIRIERTLLYDRNGNPVNPTEIAIPMVGGKDEAVPNGTPFNYYIERKTEERTFTDANGTFTQTMDVDYLVFFNYRSIAADTNVALQVLYEDVRIMDVIDLSQWELNAAAAVAVRDEAAAGASPVLSTETCEVDPLTGLVDSYVEISDVQKSVHLEFGRKDAPGSDPEKTMEDYISGDIPEPYASHFDEYVYVVWDVKAQGSANQPWELWIEQNPVINNPEEEPVQGGVVGYRNYGDAEYPFEINDEPSLSDSGYIDITPGKEGYSREEAWKTRFYVVTAYPKEQAEAEAALLENQIKLKAEPYDGDEEAKEAGSVVKEAELPEGADAMPGEGDDGSGEDSAAESRSEEDEGALFPMELPEDYVKATVYKIDSAMLGIPESGNGLVQDIDAVVYIHKDAFGQDVVFVPRLLMEEEEEYMAAAAALSNQDVESDGMIAMDLSFVAIGDAAESGADSSGTGSAEAGTVLEPSQGPVYVQLILSVEEGTAAEDLTLWHHTGDGVEKVQADIEQADGKLTVTFAADQFSTYMLTQTGDEDGNGNALVSWGPVQGVNQVESDGVTTWDASVTTLRYLKIPVRINVSFEAEEWIIKLPYVLKDEAGRKLNGQAYMPKCNTEGIENKGWKVQGIDEVNNVVTLISVDKSHGHETLDVYYDFDCWNVVSDTDFTLKCTIEKGGEGEEKETQDYELKGKIHTGHGVKLGEYANAWGDSNYAYDGFGGVDKASTYIKHWDPVYEKYFGLQEKAFDKENYIYDIVPFLVSPEGQQPYDISGCLTLDQSGELLGAVYMMDSRKRPDALCVKMKSSGGLGAPDAAGTFEAVEASDGDERKYNFTVGNDSLVLDDHYAAVSGSLSETTDSNYYTLYFLVRYPKNETADTVVRDENGTVVLENGKAIITIKLDAKLSLIHTGVDSKKPVKVEGSTCLYQGKKTFDDRIYWTSYVSNDVQNGTGLTLLRNGKPATLDFSADFFCLNEGREEFQRGIAEADLDKYMMEVIIDLAFLPELDEKEAVDNGKEEVNYHWLKDGEYRISAYRLSLIDAAGNWSQNNGGAPNVGWTPDKYGTAPGWAKEAMIHIFGSNSLEGDNWESVADIPASSVWAVDADRAFLSEYTSIEGRYARLKVVYDSRLTTALRVGYQLELQPSVAAKVAKDAITLGVTSWCNYVAYCYDNNNALVADLGTWREPVSGSPTIKAVRQYDRKHPRPGYENVADPDQGGWDSIWSNNKYSFRNFSNATLRNGEDAAGMIVSQILYDSMGKVVGSQDSLVPAETYSNQKVVTDASEIVYSIAGIVTDGSTSLEDLKQHRSKTSEGSPYQSLKQRYYVLLPEGLKLNTDPDEGKSTDDKPKRPYYHFWEEGSTWYLSPNSGFYNANSDKRVQYIGGAVQTDVPVSKGNIAGWKSNSGTNVSEMYWVAGGTVTVVENGANGNKQLLVFERTLGNWEDWDQFNLWESPIFFWGRGLSFSVVPTMGTGTLLTQQYETKFWCQFLDKDGNPISMENFITPEAGPVEELEKAMGGEVDENTLLYIPIEFNNHSAVAGSELGIKLEVDEKDRDQDLEEIVGNEIPVVMPNRTYQYKLSYEITMGKSKDVVMWCNVEGYADSQWKGTIKGVNLNGTGAKVYVQTKSTDGQQTEFKIADYKANAKKDWLTDGSHGWMPVNDLEGYDWSNVQSIAFFFEGKEFDSASSKSADVYINMQAPAKKVAVASDGPQFKTTYNQFVTTDTHLQAEGKDQTASFISPVVKLRIGTDIILYELPSTGGTGTGIFYITGTILLIGAALLLAARRSMVINLKYRTETHTGFCTTEEPLPESGSIRLGSRKRKRWREVLKD